MVNKSRWKGAHDKFPAHVEDAKNSDGNVHRGYHLLEFRVAAELLRVGPVHSAEDYWAPSDWQLLLIVSEYMSALLEFLDWFWPDLGWEHHKQAIVLSKRLLQPRSPHTFANVQIDPQLRAAWQSFTYCFWHGTRHLPTTPPPGEPAAVYSAAREWITKLVGERGFDADGQIVSSLQSWIQSTQPRLREAFPSVDWSHWPDVSWPDMDCACRTVEKRGAIKRQQEEDYAVRWPLRVTQGRPKFNHLKLEARDGFVVGIPPIKNPPALGFLAISDVMCAFKQATQHWPSTPPSSAGYVAQQDVVQSFVQNVLRETRGPLAPGIAHEKYKYLGYVACSMLGWQNAVIHLAAPLSETAAWGPLSLVFPGGTAALLQEQLPDPAPGHFGLSMGLGALGLGLPPLELGRVGVDLGIAAQLALHPQLLPGPDVVEAALAGGQMQQQQQAPPLQLQGLVAGASTAGRAVAGLVETAQTAAGAGPVPADESTAGEGPVGSVLPGSVKSATQAAPEIKPTRPRASPFLPRPAAAGAAQPSTAAAQHGQQPPPTDSSKEKQQHARAEGFQQDTFDGLAGISLGGLSSMQDLIDGLPSQADISWGALLKATADDEAAAAGPSVGPPGALSSFPPLLTPGWSGLRPPQLQLQEQASGASGPSSLQPFDSGLPYGTLQYPPVHVHPPCRAGSPFQGTITTGSLPSSGLLGSVSRTETSGPEPRLARRSHGEVFTLSPVTSCGPNGETVPNSPAAGEAAATAAAAAATAAVTAAAGLPPLEGAVSTGSLVGRSGSSLRSRDLPALPTVGRRTRQDVALAAAAAAEDTGLSPAPGSLVERSAKRPNSQTAATTERVESLGAYLTDHDAGLGRALTCPQLQAPGLPSALLGLGAPATSDRPAGGTVLGQQLLQMLRAWAEAVPVGAAGKEGEEEAAAADVHRRAAELLERGAPADAAGAESAAASGGGGADGGAGSSRAGYSALHWVCVRGDATLAELLIRAGADPDQRDAAGIPARLANPAFTAALAEVVARCGTAQSPADLRPAPVPISANTAGPSTARTFNTAFASCAATAVAAAAVAVEAAAAQPQPQPPLELWQDLCELLRKADRVAGQLALQDPAGAPQLVLQAMQGTNLLFQWASRDAAK